LNAKVAAELVSSGLAREKIALLAKAELVSQLVKRLEIDSSLVDIIERAQRVFFTDERVYLWLSHGHTLLDNVTPIEAILSGDGARVMSMLINIEHGISA
jgi:Protein of unknown function (DUF2384)